MAWHPTAVMDMTVLDEHSRSDTMTVSANQFVGYAQHWQISHGKSGNSQEVGWPGKRAARRQRKWDKCFLNGE